MTNDKSAARRKARLQKNAIYTCSINIDVVPKNRLGALSIFVAGGISGKTDKGKTIGVKCFLFELVQQQHQQQ